ncbi:hypothetical protein D3C73_978100 [compost metagenome]
MLKNTVDCIHQAVRTSSGPPVHTPQQIIFCRCDAFCECAGSLEPLAQFAVEKAEILLHRNMYIQHIPEMLIRKQMHSPEMKPDGKIQFACGLLRLSRFKRGIIDTAKRPSGFTCSRIPFPYNIHTRIRYNHFRPLSQGGWIDSWRLGSGCTCLLQSRTAPEAADIWPQSLARQKLIGPRRVGGNRIIQL